jgi:hypothetical protein
MRFRFQVKILDNAHKDYSFFIQGKLKRMVGPLQQLVDEFGDPLGFGDWPTHEADLRAATLVSKGLLLQLTLFPEDATQPPVRKFFVNGRMQVSAPVPLVFDAFDQTKLDAAQGVAVDDPQISVVAGFNQATPPVFGWRITINQHPLLALVGKTFTFADQAIRDWSAANGSAVVGATQFYHLIAFTASLDATGNPQ